MIFQLLFCRGAGVWEDTALSTVLLHVCSLDFDFLPHRLVPFITRSFRGSHLAILVVKVVSVHMKLWAYGILQRRALVA
jgi:hypothetical protein